ncbi:hypothetical protein FB45DRAFT_860946 [Roridomyces roridus]|uniref:F-box domain-containing protein n=1 Tax=Roridomyces roridus TaxID=1738132 RepID=A0AAD7G137_9AGAR|nr:hypothetical protein FB45DRAFT_860946 [Roridomyces roridus]
MASTGLWHAFVELCCRDEFSVTATTTTGTTMHRCFEIPELVDEIVSHIPHFLDKYEPFLAVLARTARLFHDSALNRLWRSQHSLHPLLLCMPPDLVQEEFLNGKRSLKFLRPIQSSDWERPHHYARRVRSFSSSSRLDDLPYSVICPLLALDAANDCIFPNLTHLLWIHSDENFPHIGLFLGPNITVLTIQCDASSLLATLSLLPRKCPSVKCLDMSHARDDSAVESTTTLPAPPRAQGPLLTALHFLQYQDPHPSVMSRLCELCLDNTLNTCELDIRCRDATQRIRSLLAALASSQRALSDLQIRIWHPDETGDSLDLIECLRPALGFAKLTRLHFLSRARFHFDDLAISEMARAWPELESLDIMMLGRAEGFRTTLQSIKHLALHCPNLRALSMDFTTDIIPSVGDASNRRMSSLDVHQSPLLTSQVHPVARFLAAIFPNLREVSSHGTADSIKDRWEEVEVLLPSHVGESTRKKNAHSSTVLQKFFQDLLRR